MKLSADERRAVLSAKDFACFDETPLRPAGSYAQPWRAAVGSAWHAKLREQLEAEDSTARFEVSVAASIPHRGWVLELNGRIDQLVQQADKVILREVKTVTRSLPVDEADLLADYPEHFLQLACYLVLAQADPKFEPKGRLEGELVFVDYRAGVIQSVKLPTSFDRFFEEQADRLVGYLEEKRRHLTRIRQITVGSAFESLRPEQDLALKDLKASVGSITAFQAPTGFGKTGVAQQAALEQLVEGQYDRVIFLSGKSTGQIQAIRQLEAFASQSKTALRFFQLRSKREHAERCLIANCDARLSCRESLEKGWRTANLTPQKYFDEGTIKMDSVITMSGETGICPFELSKSFLPYVEVWVCDYNYVFSPRHGGLFENLQDYDAERTCLIVDEAHNLPQRVADNYSFALSSYDAESVINELRYRGASGKLLAPWERWSEFLSGLKAADEHPSLIEYEAIDLLEALTEAINHAQIDWDEIQPTVADRIFDVGWHLRTLSDERMKRLAWSRSNAELRVECLDASHLIGEKLNSYASAFLMSATLEPLSLFWESIGGQTDRSRFIPAASPWREEAYSVAIDARVDTRFRRRADYYTTTADTVARLTLDSATPVAVFFPSYQYAETIRAYLNSEQPLTQVAMQPRAVDLGGQMRFIEEALLTSHALFFVLGSSFSESVDYLGGKIERAMVVGPALPEVNAIQRARIANTQTTSRDEAFRRVYILPAMHKINQALGRLVRAPGQQAKVLLHCRRFREEQYQELLDSDFVPEQTIRADDELENWLNE
ncbi:helicase C-terminal domain-containing protein [Rubellicoccus peritrichatus]|uniref:Helicase C-terminal domain-containing protein n=1 Tax=Rubellicoccus peritrichatus TaxID=3080537 RepID=A0AAQ3QU44_9BACT|nr:helicase C-terminal domain-containing protein [Puniceicoccus sp. CR14]WOO39272.1 helicase C-terminal domain-containing protein [Puniceicoccus sp. CR14]